MGDKVAYLDNGSLESGSRDFVILPRGRKTLKERLIAKISDPESMPESVYEKVLMRLGVTEAEVAEMTEEERDALMAKFPEILNDLASGLTLKQVYKLLTDDIYSPKDGDTLRAYIKAAYAKEQTAGEDIGGGVLIPDDPSHNDLV